jgi:hypothetical protein
MKIDMEAMNVKNAERDQLLAQITPRMLLGQMMGEKSAKLAWIYERVRELEAQLRK